MKFRKTKVVLNFPGNDEWEICSRVHPRVGEHVQHPIMDEDYVVENVTHFHSDLGRVVTLTEVYVWLNHKDVTAPFVESEVVEEDEAELDKFSIKVPA